MGDSVQTHFPADRYISDLNWKDLLAQLAWYSFPWSSTSREETLQRWAEHTSCPKGLPLYMLENILLIETALLWRWNGCEVCSAPQLDSYTKFSVSPNRTEEAVHHPAWLPLVLDMALSGDNLVATATFPMLSQRAIADHHFKLYNGVPQWSETTAGGQSEVVDEWELLDGNIVLPLDSARTKLVYSADGWMAASLRFTAWPYLKMGYSGRYYIEDGVMHHVCLYNSPAAGLENVKPARGPGNYGAIRKRKITLLDDGKVLVLRPDTFGGKNLTWQRLYSGGMTKDATPSSHSHFDVHVE